MNERMNKKELLKLLDSLKLDKEEFTVISSGCLVLRDIIETAGDLDLAVTQKGFEELKKNYNLEKTEKGTYQVTEKIECLLDDMIGEKERVGLYYIQDIYSYLEHIKSSKREKDIKRIPLVENYIKKRR